MSMNFKEPVDKEFQDWMAKRLEDMGAEVVDMDDRTTLINNLSVERRQMTEIANRAGQPLTVELNDKDEIKEVGGVKYRVTPKGWKKVTL